MSAVAEINHPTLVAFWGQHEQATDCRTGEAVALEALELCGAMLVGRRGLDR